MADDSSLVPGRLNQILSETSFLYGGNGPFVEDLYARWAEDPNSVEPSWRAFFASLNDRTDEVKRAVEEPSWAPPAQATARPEWVSAIDGLWPAMEAKLSARIAERRPALGADAVRAATLDSLRAVMMIRAYRMRGHLAANLDPLGLAERPDASELDPASYGFAESDYDREIFLDYVLGLETSSVREIVAILRRTYCGNVGVQYMHISNPDEKAWLQERIEGRDKEIVFTREGKIAIFKKLIESESFERFLGKRFPGTKRFGLDGGEAMVPALEQIIKRGGALGVQDIVIGMPHRGRLNVLAAVMGKPYHVIFHEFQGGSSLPSDIEGSGDVKYHLGASSDRAFDNNNVHLSLTANPSHLEIVNPVVIGKARAKQAFLLREDPNAGRGHVMPLLMHGDAAFAGQGVIAECFALMGLKGYRTGGTVHFIVNNQIGFTTSPRYSRSSPYPSDSALMVEAPIFHANGDDPEAVVYAAKVATEYRQQFAKDVVIDMFCYRRFGHNEGDDPTMTQPLMYAKIKDHPTTRELYGARLVAEGVVSQAEVDQWVADADAFLEREFEAGKTYHADKADWLDGKWAHMATADGDDRRGRTAVPLQKLRDIGMKLTAIPERLDVHKTVRRVIDHRRETIESGQGIDWATAEQLAFGSLLDEAYPVRLSGQDSVRGTFVQRHCDIVDQTTEEHYTPLNNIRKGQAPFEGIELRALGGGGAGLRVRLLARRPQHADALGGAVRRLRQRRPGRGRPVHLVRRAQVAAHVGSGDAAAARLRRSGAGAFLGQARALPAALRRGQSAGRQLFDAGQLLPHPAPADAPRVQEAADPDDAEVAASAQEGGLDAGRHGRGIVLPPGAVGRRRAPARPHDDPAQARRRHPPGHPLFGQGLLRPPRRPRGSRRGRRLPAPARAVLSLADALADDRARPLQERRAGLVPGRAEEHGRLHLRRSLARAHAGPHVDQGQARALRRPARLGVDRGGPDEPSHARAEGLPDRSVRGLREHGSMTDIMTPTLGESVTEATVARWTKKAGDPVRKDEVLVELETDKVSLEVVAPEDGVLTDIAAGEGETVEPGALLGRVSAGGAGAAAAPAAEAKPAPKAAPAAKPAARPRRRRRPPSPA